MTAYEDEITGPDIADTLHAAVFMGIGTVVFILAACVAPGVVSVVFSCLALLAAAITGAVLRAVLRIRRAALVASIEDSEPLLLTGTYVSQ
jgi:uncharacterized membrane protein